MANSMRYAESQQLMRPNTHTMGKVRGGGIQEGRLLFAMAAFSPRTLGRLASSGEKMRLLMETCCEQDQVQQARFDMP